MGAFPEAEIAGCPIGAGHDDSVDHHGFQALMPLGDRLRKYFGDPILLGLVFALSIYGVLMVYSAGQLDAPDPRVMNVWKQQIVWLIIAIGVMCVIVRIPIQWFEWAAIPAYVIGVMALMATLVIGVGKGTAASTKSWLQIGPIGVQPSRCS